MSSIRGRWMLPAGELWNPQSLFRVSVKNGNTRHHAIFFGTRLIHGNTDPFRYLGCTGCPADSHGTIWLTVSKDRPIVITLPTVLFFLFFSLFFFFLLFPPSSITYESRNVALNAVVCTKWNTLELRPPMTIITTMTTVVVSTMDVSRPFLPFVADTAFSAPFQGGGGLITRGKTNAYTRFDTNRCPSSAC